jgi:predicted CXXCH cytochrome family protein
MEAGLMHASLTGLGLVMLAALQGLAQEPAAAAAGKKDTCVECHSQMGGQLADPVTAMQGSDIHRQRSLSCADCHGGDPTQSDFSLAMNPGKGFLAHPTRQQVPGFCGKCHSSAEFMKTFNPGERVDQVTEYYSSVHGRRLRQGDQKVATCISCHGYHGVKAVSDPGAPVHPLHVTQTCGSCHANAEYMRPYGIATDQLLRWEKSVHADALLKKQDLSAPTCNDCHGNHGATPPGVKSVANVCGTCHTRQADLFEKSPHQAAFRAMGVAGCVVCHSNHEVLRPGDEWLGVGEQAVCVTCHAKDDAGYRAAGIMRGRIDELAGKIRQAEQVLQEAVNHGMEVSRVQFRLNDARDGLVNARVVVHNFSPAELDKVVNPGWEVARNAHQAGLKALDDFQFRRKGLAVSLIFISLAIAAIYLKLRQIEQRSG